jgi:hypothetical protein
VAVGGDWRLVLCDLEGAPLTNLAPIATNRTGRWRLGAPSSISFTVPSDHPLVAGTHTDGRPYLERKARTVKAFRREIDADGVWRYRIRFAGFVWSTQDESDGNGDEPSTAVTCFDPLQMMRKRLCRDSGGSPALVTVSGAVATIAQTLVDRTNTYAGVSGLTTSGGVFDTTTSARSVRWQWKDIASALRDLSGGLNGIEVYVDPLDQVNGYIGRLNAVARAGAARPDVVFAWGTGRQNTRKIRRFQDGEYVANSIRTLGATQSGDDQVVRGPFDAAASISLYRRHETVSVYSDIANTAFLDALGSDELTYRQHGRELVEVTPLPGRAPTPWIDFGLGDTFEVVAGAKLRGGFSGQQRCYGWDINMGDTEEITRILTSPEYGS